MNEEQKYVLNGLALACSWNVHKTIKGLKSIIVRFSYAKAQNVKEIETLIDELPNVLINNFDSNDLLKIEIFMKNKDNGELEELKGFGFPLIFTTN